MAAQLSCKVFALGFLILLYQDLFSTLSGQTSGFVSWSIAACQNFGRADGGAADG